MSTRIRWADPRAASGSEFVATREAMLALVRSPTGILPVAVPASNGIQHDGTLRFTDWTGQVVTAQIGDEIEVGDEGWRLIPGPQ